MRQHTLTELGHMSEISFAPEQLAAEFSFQLLYRAR
jgi:hypothetical protein